MVPFRRLVSAAIAGSRRSLSRQRLRAGPMLPTGTPSLALISVSEMGQRQGGTRARARLIRERWAELPGGGWIKAPQAL